MQPKQYPDPQAPEDQSGVAPPYAGYGQRHDIFFQYQGPNSEPVPETPTSADRASMPEVPPPPPSYQPVYTENMLPEYIDQSYNEGDGKFKKILLFGGILLTLILIVGGVLLLKNGQKPTPAPAASNTTATNTSPDKVDTPCYSFTLPPPHDKLSSSYGTCSGSFLSGSDRAAGVNVTAVTTTYASLDEMVATWKINSTTATITSEAPANFEPYRAYIITWTPSGSRSETDRTVLVYTAASGGTSSYTDGGAAVSGFEIDGRYDNQSSSKSVYDNILNSWGWK